TAPFVNGWSHFHFTKKRFLFVLQYEEGRIPQPSKDDFWDSPILYSIPYCITSSNDNRALR
ncbi:hypothetical protein, partial [Paenibacillus arenosi]|uniref:hypothetical protein n=1 Tax=Paenibacillus arenosi TaxID=2774142 RepID=UPI001CDC2D26